MGEIQMSKIGELVVEWTVAECCAAWSWVSANLWEF